MADYYKALGVKRDVDDTGIKKAYRQKAIQWHPNRNKGKNAELIAGRFAEVAEAYTVLVDSKLRAIYDQYHEKGLKRGAPNGEGGHTNGWSFDLNPETVFSDFFGSSSPFADFFDAEDGLKLFGDPDAPRKATKMPDIEQALYFTLEELYTGCLKKAVAVRQRLSENAMSLVPEERVLSVEAKPGWREGTRLTFKGEGDENAELETGDIVMIVREAPHPRFRRRKGDLLYTAQVSLRDALTGCTIHVPTLDGRSLPIFVDSIVHPKYSQNVRGEGMPDPRNPNKKGDLIIDFAVTFPEELSVAQRDALRDILQ